MEETRFQEWLSSHIPGDEYLYRAKFSEEYVFWREAILPLFTDEISRKGSVDSSFSWERLYGQIDKNSEIVGEHYSKSVVHPVVKIVFHGTTIVFRYNFYDYEVAVISDHPLELPINDLFVSRRSGFYYQGFPEKYRIEERYEDNKQKFMAHVEGRRHVFYTFLYLLKSQILKK